MNAAAKNRGIDASISCASAIIRDLDAHSCVVQIHSGGVTKDKHYLVEGIGLRFLAGRVVWVGGTKAGLFFKHPMHSAPLSRMRAALSPPDDTTAMVRLQLVD